MPGKSKPSIDPITEPTWADVIQDMNEKLALMVTKLNRSKDREQALLLQGVLVGLQKAEHELESIGAHEWKWPRLVTPYTQLMDLVDRTWKAALRSDSTPPADEARDLIDQVFPHGLPEASDATG